MEKDWTTGDIQERRAMLTRAIGSDKLVVLPGSRTGKRVFDRTRLKKLDPEEFATLATTWHAKQGTQRNTASA